MSYLTKLKARLVDPAPAPSLPFVGFGGDEGSHVSPDQGRQGCLAPPVFIEKEERKLKNQFFSQKKSLIDAGQPAEMHGEKRVEAEPPKPTKGSCQPHSGPDVWRTRFYSLSPFAMPCPGFRDREWPHVFDAAHSFLETHAEAAHALGWTGLELFGVHRLMGAVRVDACGALMLSGGADVVSVGPDVIAFDRVRFTRRPVSMDTALVWEFGQGDPASAGLLQTATPIGRASV